MSDEGRGQDEPREPAPIPRIGWPLWVSVGWIVLGAWHVLAPVNEASGWVGAVQIGVGLVSLSLARRRAQHAAELEADALPLEEATRVPAEVDDERARLDEAAAAHAEMEARLRALAHQLEQPGTPGADPDKPEPPPEPRRRGVFGRRPRARDPFHGLTDDGLPPVARW